MPKFSYSNKICGWPGLHRFSLKKLTQVYGHHGTWVPGIEEKIIMKLSDR